MQCNRCGQELAQGQTYCLCGNRVDHITGGSEASSRYEGGRAGTGNSRFLKSLIIVGITFVVALGVFFYRSGRDKYRVTHESQWETVTHAEYSMTIPSEMRDGNVIQLDDTAQTLDCFINDEVYITISVVRFTTEQQEIVQNTDFRSLMLQLFPQQTVNGVALEPKERGEMIYVEYPRTTSSMFPGTDDIRVTDACFLCDTALYEVEVSCPEEEYYTYEPYIFAWLDSFTIR